jgi:hypothetical protein
VYGQYCHPFNSESPSMAVEYQPVAASQRSMESSQTAIDALKQVDFIDRSTKKVELVVCFTNTELGVSCPQYQLIAYPIIGQLHLPLSLSLSLCIYIGASNCFSYRHLRTQR